MNIIDTARTNRRKVFWTITLRHIVTLRLHATCNMTAQHLCPCIAPSLKAIQLCWFSAALGTNGRCREQKAYDGRWGGSLLDEAEWKVRHVCEVVSIPRIPTTTVTQSLARNEGQIQLHS